MIQFSKINSDSRIPQRQKDDDAGYDLFADGSVDIYIGGQAVIGTGVRMAIPRGWVGQVWPRSGMAVKHMVNVHAGIIDSNYRGEVKVCLINHGERPVEIRKGDRIAQLVVVPYMGVSSEVSELDATERNELGFGSTGV